MPAAPSADMSKLSPDELANDVASPYTWRRETAKRMLIDKKATQVATKLNKMLSTNIDQYAAINILYTLDGINQLSSSAIDTALRHEKSSVRIQALQLADKRFNSNPELFEAALKLSNDADPIVQLQLAMSLGRGVRVLHVQQNLAAGAAAGNLLATRHLRDRGLKRLGEEPDIAVAKSSGIGGERQAGVVAGDPPATHQVCSAERTSISLTATLRSRVTM